MATDYGTDIDAVFDLPKIQTLVSGPRNVLNAIARRWQTPFGALVNIGGDPQYGEDARELLNAQADQTTIVGVTTRLARQAELDERVASCAVSANVIFSEQKATITGVITLVEGDVFEFIANISSTTVEILEA